MSDKFDFSLRVTTRAALAFLGLAVGLAMCGAASAQYSVSQMPMLVSSPPPPNIVLTIDDSGSMAWAYVPDSIKGSGGSAPYAFTSSSYNALYYNPATTYPVPPDAGGQPVPQTQGYALTSFANAYYDGFNPSLGTVNLASGYSPTLSQSGNGGPQSAVNGTTGAAYYNVFIGGAGCPATVDPTLAAPAASCFRQITVSSASGPNGTDETQNFANWYSFYRTRHLAIVSSAARAMQDPSLANARIAWQALNTCTDFTGSNCIGLLGGSFDNRIRRFSGTHKTDFYNWLFQIPAQNTTPTRLAWWRAGQYFTTSGPNSPYGVDPNQTPAVAGADLLCANNFSVTLTDGLWNTQNEGGQTTFCGTGSCGNYDSAAHTFPDGTTYTPSVASASTTIFGENPSGGDSAIDTGGLADIAFYYWSTNLRPDLTTFHVPAYMPDASTTNPATGATNDAQWPYWNPNNDPATWPHMVTFTVGVGLTGFLSLPGLVWSGNAHDPTAGSAYMNLLKAAPNCVTPTTNCTWPPVDVNASGGGFAGAGGQGNNGSTSAVLNAGNGNVYDLWHAAINSRGNAFSAESPQDLVNAMASIIARVEGQTKGNSAAAGSAPALTATTQLFVGGYDGTDWHGTVTAYNLATGTGSISSTAWQTTAASILGTGFANRKVFTASASLPGGTGTISTSPGIAFNYSSLSGANMISYFGATAAAQNLAVNYLLGDSSNEQRNGGAFRNRIVTPLGDIVDSAPVYAWKEDQGYAILPEGQSAGTGYANYVASKASRTPMVYVGANDGMLHGFDATYAASTSPSTTSELLAYVPHNVIPNLAALDNPNYLHAFYVDGPVTVGDAYFGSAGGNGSPAWRTVLVGTTGAGGRGVFALDVSNPNSFGASNVLWDLDGSASPFGNGDANLGYTIGQPVIVRLNDGNWAAIFGNGYLSTRGCAVLYIVRLYDGLVQTIDTSGAAAGTTSPCTGTNASNGLGSPTPLDLDQNGTTDYVYAGDLQGNLWKFDLSSATNSNWRVAYASGATMVPLFTATNSGGTRQPIVAAPNLGPTIGSVNGLLVYFPTGRMFASGDASDTSTQSVYAVQDQGNPILSGRSTLVAQTLVSSGDGTGNENVQSPYAVVNLASANVNGWYIDLPGSGERVLSEPILAAGMLLFPSVIPKAQPCSGGCGGFVYAVNAYSGAGGLGLLMDAANGTSYDGLATLVGCIKGLTVISNGGTLDVYASGTGGPNSGGSNPPGGGGGSGPGSSGSPTGTGSLTSGIWQPPTGQRLPPYRTSWHEYFPQ